MEQNNDYIIDLRDLEQGTHHFTYTLNDDFFTKLDGPEFQKGHVKVELDLHKSSSAFTFDFTFEGIVVVKCDYCLDDMEQDIDTDGHLDVKFGEEFNDEEELIIVDENDDTIDLSWYMYEFIALNIPLNHFHEDGECNEEMMEKLKKHICYSVNEEEEGDDSDSANLASDSAEEERDIDPRWAALKNIKIEN